MQYLKPYIDKKVAFCGKCRKTIELSNMGEQALKSHMKGKKHKANSKHVASFFQPKSVPVVQPVAIDIDDSPIWQFCATLNCVNQSKTIDIAVKINCGKTKTQNSVGN